MDFLVAPFYEGSVLPSSNRWWCRDLDGLALKEPDVKKIRLQKLGKKLTDHTLKLADNENRKSKWANIPKILH